MLTVTYPNSNAAVDGIPSSVAEQPRRSKNRFMSKPSWLLLSISDMEDKIQAINGENKPDTFGERADFYYRKRPELLALLQDLYNRYLYLADRYTRTLSKQQKLEQIHEQQEICTVLDDMINANAHQSDDESSPSYQSPHTPQKPNPSELVISELVMKFVEYEIAVDELQNLDMIQEESKKKIELQKSLLDVLESERVVLTNENSRLASESLFMKRKAGELARCVLLERTEDQRVFVLSRKIDDLQGQIYQLEKRNKEYYDKLMKHQVEVNKIEGKKSNNFSINIKRLMVKNNGGGDVSSSSSISWSGEDETGYSMSSTSNSSTCTSLAQVMKKKKSQSDINGGKKIYGWWDRVKKFDMFMCGPNLDATC
ncbi:kinase-interacting family protein-like isoform X2 [Rutidosis leptorrhynchoides]|uniref:kinase-interacting family protein-like isoform X2 n=1 Tax=Rutidosis leptorrhynchoides TaxID=125765 RepID=UPI003A98D0B1